MPTITVEDGSGVTNANSYITLEYFTDYCYDLGLQTSIGLDLEDEDEEALQRAMLRAMAYIESRDFKGCKADEDYETEWPRYGVEDRNGYALDSDVIPANLKKAQARASYEEYVDANCLQKNLTRGDLVKMEKIDVLQFEYDTYAPNSTIFQVINSYLSGLVESDGVVGSGSYANVVRT